MRRPGHIRQRSPGSWEIRYDTPGDKRHTRTVTIRGSRKDAEVELRKRLSAIDAGEHVDPTKATVAQWLTRWLEIVRTEVSPKTHERYAGILGNTLIQKLTPATVQAAYAKLASGGRRDGKTGGLSPRTRRHCHRVLYAALNRAVELQVLARNPAERMRLPKVERKDFVVLNAEQGSALLHTMRHSRVYWPTLIALATRMRLGEILALRWGKVELDRTILQVVSSLEHTRAGLRFKPPKSGKPRTITLPAFAVEALRRWKRQQAEELLSHGIRQSGDTLVCGRFDGAPKNPIALGQEFQRFVGRA
jgi:integrase